MKKLFTLSQILLLSILFTSFLPIISNGQVSLHYWDFNSGSTATANAKWVSPIPPTQTIGGGSLTHNFTKTENFAGTTLDAPGFTTTTAGTSFVPVDMANNGNSFILVVPTTGYQNIKLSYASSGSGTGYTTHVIDYSTDGTTYTNISTITGRNTAFSLSTVDFTAITAVNNNSNLKIRVTVSGATTSAGNNRFDNIRIIGNTTSTTPTVDLSVNSNTGTEAGTTAITVTATSSQAVSGDQTVTLTVTGTNITTGDYTLNSTTSNTATITILNGQTTGTATFTVIDDAVVEGTETASLTISNPSSGVTLGSNTTQNITITDNDASTVSIAAGNNAAEGSTNGTFNVTLSSPAPAGGVTITYTLTGSATSGTDYNDTQSGSITIAQGNNNGTITLIPIDDAIYEGTETIIATLNSASNGYVIGTNNATINITDNDPVPVIAVVINEVYGGGGNSGATYTHDFVELYNNGSIDVTMTNWSIQYTSAAGTSWGNSATTKVIFNGTIKAHGYFLIQLASGGTVGSPLPTADATGNINMSASSGKLALVNNSATITQVENPTDATIVDKVGYGTAATGYETAYAPGLTNSTSIQRIFNTSTSTAQDTQNNSADFISGTPSPTNSVPDITAPTVTALSPADDATGVSTSFTASMTFNERIQKGTGTITLKKSDGTIVQTIDVTTSSVTVSGSTASFSISSLEYNTSYYFEVSAGAFKDMANNNFAGISGSTTWNFTTLAIAPGGTVGTTYNFNTCTTSLPDGFTQYNVTGAQIWGCTTFGRNPADSTQNSPNGVQISGFTTSANTNEDWFISPKYDLTGTNIPLLSFWSRNAFAGNQLTLKVSTNYGGTGDPYATGTTWTTINGKFPPENSNVWTKSDSINLATFKLTNTTYIAWVYTSNTTAAARWTLDDITVFNSSVAPSPNISVNPVSWNFGYIPNGSNSYWKQFSFTASDFTDVVTLTASSNFYISKDSATANSSITYNATDVNNKTNTFYVRFSPTSADQNYTGNITFSSTGYNQRKIALSGTSLSNASTLDVVNWNIEWFGSTAQDPVNDNQQEANVKTILRYLDADIYGFSEIVDTMRFRRVVDSLGTDFGYAIADYGSYAPNASDPDYASAQKNGFIYRKSIFSNVTTRGILRYHATQQQTDSSSYWWASGRFPYLLNADVTLQGVTKNINFIVIHAKANTGPDAEKIEAYYRRKMASRELKDTLDFNFTTANVILFGDYNDDLDRTIAPTTGADTVSSYYNFVIDSTDAISYRSVTLPLSLSKQHSTVSFPDVIDHTIISDELDPYYLDGSAQIRTDVASQVNNYGSTTTDHYPIHTRYKFTIPSLITDHFRTKQNGMWNAVATWESSADGITWSPATVTPDFNSNTITILNTDTVIITVNLTIDQTTINSGGVLIVNPNIVLTINNGAGTDLTINTGGYMTIMSTATGTGMIGTSTGTVSGNAIVQRFISSASARSAWRLLTAPVRSTTGVNGTIFNNWQSGGISIPGIATTVTGPNYNGSGLPGTPVPDANGLDYHTPLPSMQWWDVVDQTLQPVTVTNNPAINPLFTTAPTAANRSYYIFINGDRFAYSGRPNTTILPAVGELQMGDQVFTLSSTANAFNLVGNPYASPVDLNLLRLDNTANNVNSTYYYWDPYLTGAYGVGGYVTVSYDGMGNETITPSGADRTRFLQSGQAMFVQTNTSGASSLVFKETQKSTTNVNNIFRTATGQIENIRVDLKVINGGNSALVDGIVTGFDISYAAAIDRYDAVKFYNIGESIAFMRDGKSLSIERRPLIKSEDILFLNLVNLQAGKGYQFEINPSLNITGLTAYLVDNYLKTTTPIDLNKATTVNFMVTGDAASTGANRFSIAFAKPAIVQAVKPGISVYPNPVTNGIINLQMNNMPQGIYTVRIFNSLGQTMLTRQINHTSGSRTETLRLGKGVKGVYNIEVIKPDNSKFSSKVIAN